MLAAQPLARSLLAGFLLAGPPGWAQQVLDEFPKEHHPSLREAFLEATQRVVPGAGGVLEAPNPAQGMRSSFASDGVQIRADESRRAWTLRLALEGWGRVGALLAPEPVEPTGQGRRVEYRRGALTEWYVNGARGLEQGFTLDERPAGEGALEIVLAIGDRFAAHVEPGGRDALLTDRATGRTLHYAGLRAWDATGRELEAALAVEGRLLAIRVDDRGAAYPLHVDPWIATEEAVLTASDAASVDDFGGSVAVDGDTAVVGAPDDDHAAGANAGSAYVFVRSGATWTEQQKLVASDAEGSDSFGESVAIAGDTVLVGGTSAEGAYVFVRSGTTWTEQQKLTGSDTGPVDFFGSSVALSGDTALVGAFAKGLSNAGAAYVFVRNGTTWTEQQKLTGDDESSYSHFGTAVALSGDTAVISAPNQAPATYFFVRNGMTWTLQQELVGLSGGVFLPDSIAVAGDTAVIGGTSAQVFVRSGTTWSEQQELTGGPGVDHFGFAVAILGDMIAVGAPADSNAGGAEAGATYLFARSGTVWSEEAKLTASDAEPFDSFGADVALSAAALLVGAESGDASGLHDAGAAYVFRLDPAGASYCTAGVSASGCQALLSATGAASAGAAGGFALQASTVEGAKDGMFFWGTSGKQAQPWGNGTSFQCVVPPVTRGGTLAGSGTSGACDGSFTQDLNAAWCAACPYPQKNPGAGAVVQAQLWYRDPLSTSNQTTSLSDAIEFSVGP